MYMYTPSGVKYCVSNVQLGNYLSVMVYAFYSALFCSAKLEALLYLPEVLYYVD